MVFHWPDSTSSLIDSAASALKMSICRRHRESEGVRNQRREEEEGEEREKREGKDERGARTYP